MRTNFQASMENALNPFRLFGLINNCPKCGGKGKKIGTAFAGVPYTKYKCKICKYKY